VRSVSKPYSQKLFNLTFCDTDATSAYMHDDAPQATQDQIFDRDGTPSLILPANVTIEEIEAHLDRLAVAATVSPRCQEFLDWYSWLEGQLAAKRQQMAVRSSISARVRRLKDRTAEPS
jgi:hypothetical protein